MLCREEGGGADDDYDMMTLTMTLKMAMTMTMMVTITMMVTMTMTMTVTMTVTKTVTMTSIIGRQPYALQGGGWGCRQCPPRTQCSGSSGGGSPQSPIYF